MPNFCSKEVRQLLHNKFVVILGDSIQRSVYKDLIWLLQKDSLLSSSQMKSKGELSFENDHLIEGGLLGTLHNGTHYREVRQFRTDHHLIRFYFLTRVYSEYLESILDDFRQGLLPDVLVLNSCIWDLSRYGSSSMKEYCVNLQAIFNRLDAVLPASCLVLWNMTMPLGPKVTGGFLIPELQHLSQSLRNDVIEGNFYGATLAGLHLFDVLDLHFHFRHDLGNRVKDGVHWNNVVHRRITNLLLAHVADAWGVVIPDTKFGEAAVLNTVQDCRSATTAVPYPSLLPPHLFCSKENIHPRSSHRKWKTHRVKDSCGLVMRRQSFRPNDPSPYYRTPPEMCTRAMGRTVSSGSAAEVKPGWRKGAPFGVPVERLPCRFSTCAGSFCT